MSILLNSSKQAQAPALASPLKNFPMAMKSNWSEQLNTTHWTAIAFARSCEDMKKESTSAIVLDELVYNDGEISTCGEIIEVHSVQSTVMGRSQQVGRL